MKSSFCIDLQRFMLIPTKFPLSRLIAASLCLLPTKKVSTSYEVDTLTVCILTGYHACLSRQAIGVHPSFSLNTL